MFSLYAADYIFKQGKVCYTAFRDAEGYNFATFGDVFLRKYYTMEQIRIGFAESKAAT